MTDTQATTTELQVYSSNTPFALESGIELPGLHVAYQSWGELDENRSNVIWICHALTGSSDAASWWQGLVGPGLVFDTDRYFVICANMLGSCYGSTGPASVDPATGSPWLNGFPLVTIRDMVRAMIVLRVHLGIQRIAVCVGGSMGGQQVLEWAVMEPERIERIIPIATNARHSPWGIAFNAAQRLALEADPSFTDGSVKGGGRGLSAARAIGMISYRTAVLYNGRQRDEDERLDDYRAESYQRHQGAKLVQRFSAHAYWVLSKAMDSHDLGRGRGGAGAALRGIRARTLVIGIDSDILFPTAEQTFIADQIPGAGYRVLKSPAGHDAFLIDQDRLASIIRTSTILH